MEAMKLQVIEMEAWKSFTQIYVSRWDEGQV